ncbi:unnamed protein product [Rotaria sp. Silwood1]|nr:unnamed protein product [Rotaria sp. Silwood1]
MMQDLFIKPSNYILSPFNDSHWGPIHIVTEATDFVDLIKELNATDLRNSSQRYYDALNEALKACESESLVFMFTDAPAHEPCSQGLTRALAKLKQTKIDILFVNNSHSRTETINELIHFAETTGGLFMNVDISQPNTIRKFLFRNLKKVVGYECILFESMSNRRQGTFMIDSTAISLQVNIVSSSLSSVVYLIDPTGLTFQPTPSSEGDYLQKFIINISKESNIGQWTYHCSDDCTIEVNVKSKFRCRTQLHAPFYDKIFKLVATPPLVNQSDAIAITTCDDPNEALNNSVQLIGTNGEILMNYSTTTNFVIPIEIPSQSFRIRTCIGRHDGTLTYREERVLIDTSRIMMAIIDQPLVAISNESLNVTYRIRNDADTPLYVQLDIDDALTTSKWYSIAQMSTLDDFIIIDMSRYPFIENETVRLVPLAFALQAFKNKHTIASDSILFRHEQIVPLYVQSTAMHLEPPMHFINIT